MDIRPNVSDLELLSDSAARFLSHEFKGDIYQFIGEGLNKLTGETLVVVNEYDCEKHATLVRALTGPAEWRDEFTRFLVNEPLELSFLEGSHLQITPGKLTRVEGGLFDLATGGTSREFCAQIERQLGICAIFAIPLVARNDFLGFIAIFGRDSRFPAKTHVIEAFTGLAAMALQQDRVEQERKRLLRQLEDERTLWKTTVESMPDPVTVCDPQGIATYMNQAYSRLIRLSIDPTINLDEHQNYYRIFHPDGTPFQASDLPLQRAAFNDEIVPEVELVHQVQGGDDRHVIFNAAPLHAGDGRVLGAVAVGRDITAQRQAEYALRKAYDELEVRIKERTQDLELANQELSQEISFRRQAEGQVHLQMAALEAAAGGIVITDRHANIVWCNPAFTRITSYTREELLGQNPRMLSSGLHDRAYYKNMWETILAGKVWYGETINRHKDGSLYTVEGSITPVFNEEGKITHFISIKQDITERKRDLELIHLHTARAETLARVAARLNAQLDLDAVMQAICEETAAVLDVPFATVSIYDPRQDSFKVAWGSGFQAGYVEQLPVMPTAIFMRKALPGEPVVLIMDTKEQSSQMAAELYQKLNVRSLAVSIMHHENVIVGALNVLAQDKPRQFSQDDLAMLQALADQAALAITNARLYRDLENALSKEQAMRRQLIESEKHNALSRMVASVAHEINNPLQTIKNCLYLTEQEVQEGPALEYLDMATAETRRISNLVSQLRDIYRPGKIESPRRLPLGKLLDEVYALLIPHLQYNQVIWSIKGSTGNLAITAVSDQIKQVFLNIALNAIEAMQPAGGTIEVTVASQKDQNREDPAAGSMKPGQVAISFKDSGPGISEENLNRIFEPFFTTKETGTGLGLPICYDIVKRVNGEITVESQPGHGAKFTIYLPLA